MRVGRMRATRPLFISPSGRGQRVAIGCAGNFSAPRANDPGGCDGSIIGFLNCTISDSNLIYTLISIPFLVAQASVKPELIWIRAVCICKSGHLFLK
ncbi:hypothetical protein M2323_003266 [Rhodoblastus acidophilus]|nr:hypothetical protein [Rhodoblastus acidophilus]MCW2334325.1 hypothetical protein [Rhodoblastus acidophilus]